MAGEALNRDLGMALSARQEGYADAFLVAVAAAAGCSLARPSVDNDSVDWTLACRLPRRPKIDVQMKSTVNDNGDATLIRYALPLNNYRGLILTELVAPRILVLVIVPRDTAQWFQMTAEQLVLRHCAYWASLAGLPQTENETTVTVSVPRTNLLTPDALSTMMQRVDAGGLP